MSCPLCGKELKPNEKCQPCPFCTVGTMCNNCYTLHIRKVVHNMSSELLYEISMKYDRPTSDSLPKVGCPPIHKMKCPMRHIAKITNHKSVERENDHEDDRRPFNLSTFHGTGWYDDGNDVPPGFGTY